MEMLDFWCPENGITHNKCVLIKIPKVCCGKPTKIAANYLGTDKSPTAFDTCCDIHLGSYKDIIKEYKSNWKFQINWPEEQSSGHTCACGYYNEYAEANQKDGSYKCFNCR